MSGERFWPEGPDKIFDGIDPELVSEMLDVRNDYEYLAAEAGMMELVYGKDALQAEPAFAEGVTLWMDAAKMDNPEKAQAMLAVFARGDESSRSFVAVQAPSFMHRNLVSYHQGMSYMHEMLEDVSPDVVDTACRSILARYDTLLQSAKESGDELAPKRLERLANAISYTPSHPGGYDPSPYSIA